jgi:hypothetical protein
MYLPGTWIRRTARKMPVLKRRENRLQLAIIRDGRRSVVSIVEWIQDMIFFFFYSYQSKISFSNDTKQNAHMLRESCHTSTCHCRFFIRLYMSLFLVSCAYTLFFSILAILHSFIISFPMTALVLSVSPDDEY